jgi:hypothetical protein
MTENTEQTGSSFPAMPVASHAIPYYMPLDLDDAERAALVSDHLQIRRNGGEDIGQAGADERHCSDSGNGDQGGDQAVFNRRGAIFVIPQFDYRDEHLKVLLGLSVHFTPQSLAKL